jgi:hypothetical protein
MRGVGLRELVAIGVLGIAGFMGFLFFDPSSTDGSNKPLERSTTPQVILPGTPTPAASAAPAPTQVPVAKLGEPGGQWQVGYYESATAGQGIRGGEGFIDNLEFDFAGRPFPDFEDDNWRLVASQSMELSAGRYGFVLQSDGALRVTAGDNILLDVPDSQQRQTHALEFDHKGGRVNIAIELRDTGGPVFLRWTD